MPNTNAKTQKRAEGDKVRSGCENNVRNKNAENFKNDVISLENECKALKSDRELKEKIKIQKYPWNYLHIALEGEKLHKEVSKM